MIEYTDAFGRVTIIEALPSEYNKRLSLVIRKERQAIYESIELDIAKTLLEELRRSIRIIENV